MTRDEIIRDIMMDYKYLICSMTLNSMLRSGDCYSLGHFCGSARQLARNAHVIGERELAERIERTIYSAHAMIEFGGRQ